VEVMDEAGKVLAKRRLPEGVAGMTQLHELIGRFVPEDAGDVEVVIGIETDRGPWVAALVAAGAEVAAEALVARIAGTPIPIDSATADAVTTRALSSLMCLPLSHFSHAVTT